MEGFLRQNAGKTGLASNRNSQNARSHISILPLCFVAALLSTDVGLIEFNNAVSFGALAPTMAP